LTASNSDCGKEKRDRCRSKARQIHEQHCSWRVARVEIAAGCELRSRAKSRLRTDFARPERSRAPRSGVFRPYFNLIGYRPRHSHFEALRMRGFAQSNVY
jgi:hypothetical protein